jgi:hypothetical protein
LLRNGWVGNELALVYWLLHQERISNFVCRGNLNLNWPNSLIREYIFVEYTP